MAGAFHIFKPKDWEVSSQEGVIKEIWAEWITMSPCNNSGLVGVSNENQITLLCSCVCLSGVQGWIMRGLGWRNGAENTKLFNATTRQLRFIIYFVIISGWEDSCCLSTQLIDQLYNSEKVYAVWKYTWWPNQLSLNGKGSRLWVDNSTIRRADEHWAMSEQF